MIEILCTVAGIIAGVAVVGSLFRDDATRAQFESNESDQEPERIKEIANQLQLISDRVAANVSAHNDKVEHFSDQLGEAENEPGMVYSAIDDIIEANRSMQAELASAQKRIAEQSEMIEQASQQARTDALTGLANRRALDEYLTDFIENTPTGEVVGLLLMDIDHFKSFNDSYGHTTGDAVLSSFARSITKCCGPEAYAARYGGEEFAVILAAESEEELVRKSAHIRKYVSEQVISYDNLQLKVTSSAGVSVLSGDDTINSAYERADEGLYKSKESGRNCGHWLAADGWKPFPTGTAEPEETPKPALKKKKKPKKKPAKKEQPPELKKPEPAPQPTKDEPEVTKPDESPAITDEGSQAETDRAEILDLKSFLERLEQSLEQLQRADYPGSGLMIEAIGLSDSDDRDSLESWDTVIQLVQLNLRGIDVVCQYRLNTLCVFMSSVSQNVALDRAAMIQTSLAEAKSDWAAKECPERFAISVASVQENEKGSQFLNRLEAALDDAHDASETQVVVHDGETRHFQDV